jgi:zinc protease
MSSVSLPLLAALLTAPAAEAKDDSKLALRTAEALYSGIKSEELPNGLRVFLKPIPGSPAVTTMLAYKVGSCDEDKSFTGLAHYLEHLLFKGTKKLKPGDIDRITFRTGGSNNAYTSHDMTAYHFTLPAGRWKAALEVEADRMRNVIINKEYEFDKEKGAVIAELARGEDTPWDLEYKAILPRLFGKGHPYGHPVIGERKHVADANEKVIKDYYDRWYHPNNASLILVGGFDANEALKEIKKLFGDIPRGKLPARKEVPAKQVKLPVRYEMESKFSVPRLLIGYPTIKYGEKDQAALNVLEGVLATGKRSRLYRALVEGAEVASEVSADNSPGRYPGWMGVYVALLPGKDRATVEKLTLAELTSLREKSIDEAELKRVKQLLLSAAVFRREGTYGLADSIGQAVTLADLDFAKKYLPAVLAVSADDVRRVAKKYLDPDRSVTVWSVPLARKEKEQAAARFGDASRKRSEPARSASQKADREVAFDLSKARRVVLDNGLVVVLFENKRLPIFEARLVLKEAGLLQPDDKLGVYSLTASLLDEGTSKRTGAQIAQAIEGVGGTLSAASGSVRSLSPDRKLALGLLVECLTQPSFPDESFKRNKQQLLAEIGENETLPEVRAAQTFRSLVYGKHPLGRPSSGTTKTAGALKRDDCVAFHKKVYVPGNAILVLVGDFDAREMLAEARTLTAGWKKADVPKLDAPAPKPLEKFTEKVVSMPRAAQLHVYLGQLGIKRNDPDYYKLLVMDYILGTGPGFTYRLSSLRDREGLAYTVQGTITTTAGTQTGLFSCYIGTEPENYARVKKLLLAEINKMRKEKVTPEELADARAYLTGSQLLAFSTDGGIAGQLLAIERFGLGFTYLKDYQRQVSAVTAGDVLEVAKKHLDPEKMALVASGPIDDKGEVVKPKEE